jgi:hypothetical protein
MQLNLSAGTDGGQYAPSRCPGGELAQCGWVNENYDCVCPPASPIDAGTTVLPPVQPAPLVAYDAAPVPTVPPVLPSDAAPLSATPSPDAKLPEFPTFHPVTPPDASPIDAPITVTKPEPTSQPDAYVPTIVFPTFPKPETPDALVVINIPEPDARPVPDTKLPEDTKPAIKLDCGCVEESTPPAIIHDASVPDTTPVVIVPDAGIDLMPDLMPDTTPDTTPDLTPDTTPQPDACTSIASITITSTQLTCGTMINWSVVGCAPSGFKVLWSLNEGPTYPPRAGDNWFHAVNQSDRSHEIHDTNGANTYYVRVCEFVNGACGTYSNELVIQMTK